jgi:hypothetical protein
MSSVTALGMTAIFLVVITQLIVEVLADAAFTGILATITGFIAVIIWLIYLRDAASKVQ